MRKILLLNVFMVLGAAAATAQAYVPFPTHDAIWTEVYRPHGDSAWRMRYYALKNEDTTINSIVYHKLYSSADTVFGAQEYYMAIREDNDKKVFGYANGGEFLLYDFSAQEGDTIYQNTNGGMNNWNIDLIVYSVDSVSVNGVFRRRINLGHPSNPSANFYSAWVDGIGNFVRGLTFPSGTYPINGTWAELVCFKQDNVLEWQHNQGWQNPAMAFANCGLLIQDVEEADKNAMTPVFAPNPLTGHSYLILDRKAGFESLIICDVLGRKVLAADVRGEEKLMIERKSMHAGVYSYLLTGSNGQKATGKFIVQ